MVIRDVGASVKHPYHDFVNFVPISSPLDLDSGGGFQIVCKSKWVVRLPYSLRICIVSELISKISQEFVYQIDKRDGAPSMPETGVQQSYIPYHYRKKDANECLRGQSSLDRYRNVGRYLRCPTYWRARLASLPSPLFKPASNVILMRCRSSFLFEAVPYWASLSNQPLSNAYSCKRDATSLRSNNMACRVSFLSRSNGCRVRLSSL